MVDEDLVGIDDFGDDGDMTGGDALRPLKDKYRSDRWGMAALIPPFGLVPPPTGVTEECNPGLGASIKHAIGRGRWLGGSDEVRNQKRAPNERQH